MQISTEALAEFMDVSTAAEVLGISHNSVRRFDRVLVPIRLGRRQVRYYNPDRVIALRDARQGA